MIFGGTFGIPNPEAGQIRWFSCIATLMFLSFAEILGFTQGLLYSISLRLRGSSFEKLNQL